MPDNRSRKLISLWKASAIILTLAVLGLMIFKRDEPTPIEAEKAAPVEKIKTPKARTKDPFSPESLVSQGKLIIFGTDQPELNEGGRLPLGKGQCAFCHLFVAEQKSDRCPDLRGIEARSHLRPKEVRYQEFSNTYAQESETDSGLKPKAKTGGEYILESLYCPNCYVVEGYGLPDSGGQQSEMPIMKRMPWQLNDFELVAVAAYLQAMESPGDFSKVTVKQDWERYFNRELTLPEAEVSLTISAESIENTALISDPIEVIVEKMRCFVCHKIPSVPVAQTGLIGPVLTLKTNAALRLASSEYRKAVKEGRASASTPKEYVIESILNPSAFVVSDFRDGMPSDYSRKFTVGALHKLADFLLTLDESMVEKDPSEALESLDEDESPNPKFN